MHNGKLLYSASILKHVVSSASEAEMGALCVNMKEAEVIKTMLEDMGWPQHKPTTIATDKSTEVCIFNYTINKRLSKSMDMRFYWCQDRVSQKRFCVYWNSVKVNLSYYYSKHHAEKHHQMVRPIYLNKKNIPETFLWMLIWVWKGVYILIREVHKALTLIYSYVKQTTEDNHRKCAPHADGNSRAPSAQYRGIHNINNLKFDRRHGPFCRRPYLYL